MHKNMIYRSFLLVLLVITLWYSGIAIYRYYSYIRLTVKTEVSAIEWKVKELADDEFIPLATYSFRINGQVYTGSYEGVDDKYRNHWAVDQKVKELSLDKWEVWVDANKPDYSNLKKNIPFKECISALFLWGLILYFLWLGFYVGKFNMSE